MAPTSDTTALFLGAKQSLDSRPLDLTDQATVQMIKNATVDENGLAVTDMACMSEDSTEKIMLAKAHLNGDTSVPSQEAISAAAPRSEQDAGFQKFMIASGTNPGGISQGNDLFFATNAMNGHYDSLLGRKTELSLSSTAPDTAVTAPASSTPLKPQAAPALAV